MDSDEKKRGGSLNLDTDDPSVLDKLPKWSPSLENLMTILLEVPPSVIPSLWSTKWLHPSQKPSALTRCERVHHQAVGGLGQLCYKGLGLGPFPSLQFYDIQRECAKRSLVCMRYTHFVRNLNVNRGCNWLFLNKEWNQHFQNICCCTIALSTV